MQSTCFKNATLFAFVMMTIGVPIMLIIKIDCHISINEKIVFIPVAVLWLGYLIAQIYAWIKIKQFTK